MIKSNFLLHPLSWYSSRSIISNNRVGAISDDRSAVVGNSNWCFIYEGSNNYYKSYIEEGLSSTKDEWIGIIEARQILCTELDIQFLQLIIPNKLTLIPYFFPGTLNTDVSFLMKELMNKRVNANLLIPVSDLRKNSVREAIFRRNDSHLTISGNAYLADLIIKNLGIPISRIPKISTQEILHIGDLGGKFSNAVPEEMSAPLWDQGLFDQKNLNKIEDFDPGRLVGIRQVFINHKAPIEKKLVVFGNSFFERVPSWGLSPFFAAIFLEFHFIWSPNIDLNYLINGKFDIVICQTCERFLTQAPDARI